ncbi:MAG: caspase family protein, partial [Candidatus Delongbacteria bacterium]|nr:caspase family protein [Candidatus Delongbacteria bacterium]
DAEKLELSKGTHTGALYKDKQAGISVTNWEDSYSPELNGKKSGFLKQYEINRSAAITDENTIIWGADWTLYKTDRDGNVLWKIPVPGEVWAVNSIGDIVTAAYDDGTIRWHRLSDGKELMALMINDDMKRWVLYTLEGYYASSPGGEELIGWHINNGKDKEADFFPASRFAERFYRPDILELVLELKDTEKAIETANKTRNIKTTALISESLPPIVNIINPSSGYFSNSETVEITASIRTLTEQPVTETKILLNGRLYEGGERGISIKSKDGAERKYKIKVLQGENTISVLARNNSGWSEASTIRVNYKNTTGEDQDFVIMPKLYILAIGVSDYNDSSLKLRYPSKDANDFAEVMKKQEKKLYREVVIRLLTDQNATKDNILDGLEWIQRETTSKDVAMIFIAGHGMNDSSGDLYYLPQDVRIDKLKRTGLLAEEVINTISSIAGKVIYFMDTCHSGNMKVTGRRGEAVDATKVVMELSSAENGAIVFASSTGRQYSLEDDKWNNGAFTKALVEGLSGKAAITGTERISINMLDLYISERVKDLTGGKQHPTTAKPDMIRDFPIAVK